MTRSTKEVERSVSSEVFVISISERDVDVLTVIDDEVVVWRDDREPGWISDDGFVRRRRVLDVEVRGTLLRGGGGWAR